MLHQPHGHNAKKAAILLHHHDGQFTSSMRRITGRRLSRLFWFGGIILAFSTFFIQHVQVIIAIDDHASFTGRDTMIPPHKKQKMSTSTLANVSDLSQEMHHATITSTNSTNDETFQRHDRTNNKSTTIARSTTNMKHVSGYYNPQIQEFEHQPGVVIVTKIHDAAYVPMLEQMLCLLHQAYNHRLLYDIVVFTTEPIERSAIVNLTQAVAPANIRVLQDNLGLQQEIANLTPERRAQFVKQCELQDESQLLNLTWWSKCPGRIAYNWQAEFRSWHIWNHPVLEPYHWMMWLDADAFCSKVWTRDPIAIAIQHNVTILFDNFPQGYAGGREIQKRIRKAFGGNQKNSCLCNIDMSPLGHLRSQVNQECVVNETQDGRKSGNNIPLIHGFFHITNMDFYRSPPVLHWAETLIGNGFLQRNFDDQVAVTVPAAYFTPHQSWLMRKVGIDLGVYHNGKLDGIYKMPGGGFKRWWYKKEGSKNFPEAAEVCVVVAGG